jgi:hypothetical protein
MVPAKLMFAGAAVVALGTLAACGSNTPPTQPPQTVTVTESPSTPPSTSASTPERPAHVKSGPARCNASTLSGEIVAGDAAAGNRYAKLVVTNTGKTACTLYGYGGMQLVDAAGKPNPTKLDREGDPGPSLVTLEPGQKANKNLHWGAVPDGSEPTTGPCEPASTGATVIPPDETQHFTVKFDFGSVCEKGEIDGSAYYK